MTVETCPVCGELPTARIGKPRRYECDNGHAWGNVPVEP